jgi:hypothetical protein
LTAADDLPIAATGFVSLIGERKRVSTMSMVGEPDTLNALPVVPQGAAAEIAVYNPGQADATVTVAVGGQVPDQWSSIALPAGTMQLLSFADAGLTTASAGGGAGEGGGDAGEEPAREGRDAQDEQAQDEAASEGASEPVGRDPAGGQTTSAASVEASADQPIYATLRLASPRNRVDQFLTLPLVPANMWQGSADAPIPQRDRALDTRPVPFPADTDR